MYLQRIELQGFKSFANKTVLEFPTPNKKDNTSGITAIVGPNGSGKSNVVDAVRWVLGEQSLKLLRGKKATDVIFSGSAKKSQMGLAEVSLHLNNEDKGAPIDYSEIVITRRLYRDGNSEYLLNKNEVRLFDIVMLLAKANFGQNTYSIIGQGMVDKIVNYSGAERKEFFDEATGVKQYQIKRDRSVNKLRRSRENLEQAKILIKELEPHLKSLTRQVNKLHQRQELEKELKEIQEKYYGKLWQDLGKHYEELALSYNTWDKQRLRLENKISELQNRLDEIGQEGSRTDEFNRLQEQYQALQNKQNEILKELTIIRGKLDLEYAKIGKQDLSWMENRKAELEQKLKDLNNDIKNFDLRLKSNSQKLSDKERSLQVVNDELAVWQNNLEIMQDEFYRLKSGGGRINHGWESVRAVLELKNSIAGIFGTVSDIGRVKNSRYEAALASAAGNRLQAVVVDNDETAVKCISWLKANRLAPVTFFPLNRLKEYAASHEAKELAREEGAVGLAVDLVSFETRFVKVFQQVFGSTVIVGDLEIAKRLGINRERMVTLDGDVLEKTGIMKGGFKKAEFLSWKSVEDKFFPEAKIKEISSLKAKLEEQRRDRDQLLSQIASLKGEIQLDEARVKNVKAEESAYRVEKEKIIGSLAEANLTPEQQDQYFKDLQKKKEEQEKELSKLDKEFNAARDQIDQFNFEAEKKKQEILSTQQEMHNLQNELNKINDSLSGVKIELAKVETRKEDVFLSIKEDLGEDFKFSSREDFGEIDLEDFKSRIDRLKKQLELIGGIDPEIEKEYNEVKTRFEFLSQQSEDLEKAIKDLEKVVEELDKLIKSQFEDEFKKINRDFSRYFKQLFEGGSAKLVLVQKQAEQTEAEILREQMAQADSSAPLEGEDVGEVSDEKEAKQALHVEDKLFLADMGIDIEACPPGKKIKSITMLSGGEKTMTALALICAIIFNNPSPFILFDEVDAALDESNSSKFSGIVRELSHKTQFIIITHNRAIMSASDVLYGVTMQGDGVSRLLSLKLAEAEKMTK